MLDGEAGVSAERHRSQSEDKLIHGSNGHTQEEDRVLRPKQGRTLVDCLHHLGFIAITQVINHMQYNPLLSVFRSMHSSLEYNGFNAAVHSRHTMLRLWMPSVHPMRSR